MKTKKLPAACALLMAIAAAAMSIQPLGAAAADTAALEAYANEVVVLVNEERAIYGLEPVKAVPVLNDAAQRRAEETVQQFSHTRPDGRASSSVLEDFDIDWRSCGENIAYGYQDAEAVMDGWMHSEGHRANILNAGFEYIGVGVTERGGVIYCTQVFTGGAVPVSGDAPTETVTVPAATEEAAPSGTSAPCIGDACPEIRCTDGSCGDAQEICIGASCGDAQEICIGGNCISLPGGTCPTNLLPALLGGNSGSCGIGNLLCKLTGSC